MLIVRIDAWVRDLDVGLGLPRAEQGSKGAAVLRVMPNAIWV